MSEENTSGEQAGREQGQDSGLRGVAEEVKDRAKEAFGALAGDDERKQEGATQQEAADAEAQAEQARQQAEQRERQQRDTQ